MTAKKPVNAGDLYLLVTVAIWGNTFPTAKYVLGSLPPFSYAGIRYFIAALALMGLLAWRQGLSLPRRRDLPALLLLGLLGVTMMQLFWTNGLTMTSASKGAILVGISPLFVMLFTALRALSRGERGPGLLAWSGVVVSFAGVFLIINNSLTALNITGGDVVGDLLFIATALCWASYSMLAPPYLASMGPLRVTAWSMLFGALMLLPFSLLDIHRVDLASLSAGVWAGFGYTAILAGALGYLWWYEGVARLGAARAASYSYLIPVFALISAVLVLGEDFSLLQGIGTAIVLGGLVATRIGMQRGQQA
ncbi:DMT family transporter [Ferrovibrio sp.]|uniref:DMT family transporter n=1 Tax=Ferrovibrio sp. TaxID=1917215 RepID=UPI001B686FFF|nr:DMT family transporter [Ferrovibrio sp.]MBP7064408.1 DMT family transporter [Ferrovibrio sp.]